MIVVALHNTVYARTLCLNSRTCRGDGQQSSCDIAGWILGNERFLHTHSNRVLAQFIYPLAASPCFDGTLNAEVIEVQTNREPDLRIKFMYRGDAGLKAVNAAGAAIKTMRTR